MMDLSREQLGWISIIGIVLFGLILVILAFAIPEPEEKTVESEIIFIEKSDRYEELSLIFEDPKEKEYYAIVVDSWTFNNLTFKEGEKFTLSIKDNFKDIYFWKPDGFINIEKDLFIFDEWKPLFIVDSYVMN